MGHHTFRLSDWTIIPVIAFNQQSKSVCQAPYKYFRTGASELWFCCKTIVYFYFYHIYNKKKDNVIKIISILQKSTADMSTGWAK